MKPLIWAILAALAWGVAPVVEKLGLLKIPVWGGLIFRSLGVVLGMLGIIIFKFAEVKNVLTKIPAGWYYLLAGGFLASIVGQIFFYNALKTGEASKVVPIAASYPLVSFLLGLLFLSESLTLTKVGGLALILMGIFLLK